METGNCSNLTDKQCCCRHITSSELLGCCSSLMCRSRMTQARSSRLMDYGPQNSRPALQCQVAVSRRFYRCRRFYHKIVAVAIVEAVSREILLALLRANVMHPVCPGIIVAAQSSLMHQHYQDQSCRNRHRSALVLRCRPFHSTLWSASRLAACTNRQAVLQDGRTDRRS